MSEGTSERGILTDLLILVVIVGLGLAAIYFSGNWPWFLKIIANLGTEIQDFIDMFVGNIKSVSDAVQGAQQHL